MAAGFKFTCTVLWSLFGITTRSIADTQDYICIGYRFATLSSHFQYYVCPTASRCLSGRVVVGTYAASRCHFGFVIQCSFEPATRSHQLHAPRHAGSIFAGRRWRLAGARVDVTTVVCTDSVSWLCGARALMKSGIAHTSYPRRFQVRYS